jgi:hypothetical protein
VTADGQRLWPEPLWRDVADAMAQACAESGDCTLGEPELDAVADGYLPDPEYRSRTGFRPTPAEFMQPGYGEPPGYGQSIWAFGEPQGEQAYWDVFGNTGMRDEDMMWRRDPDYQDPYEPARNPGHSPGPCGCRVCGGRACRDCPECNDYAAAADDATWD